MNRRMFLGQAAMAYGAFLLNARAQETSLAPRLTIREIRAVRLRDGFNSRFVRVYTDQGLTGTGEMLDTVGAEYIVNHNIGPSLAGRDPLDIEGILFDLWGWKHLSAGGAPSPLFMRGMGGPYLTAMSGVEMALWDLAGKALNAPVYQLLGGCVRNKLPVYLHAANAAEATSLIAKTNVKALKIGIDYSPDAWTLKKGWDPDKLWGLRLNTVQLDDVVNFVASIREAVGKSYDLALECHARYDVETAIQLCRLLEPFRLIWVEEPVPSDDVEAMLRVRNNTRVPIAAGENIYSRYGFRPFSGKGSAQRDSAGCFKDWRAARNAQDRRHGRSLFDPDCAAWCGLPLATMAAAHVAAATPNLMLLEWTHYLDKSYTSLTEPVALNDNGFLEVANKPGIGVALNDDAVKERTESEFHPL